MIDRRSTITLILASTLVLLWQALPAAAEDQTFVLHVEVGATWQERNKVQIPNDDEGTKFSMQDVAGSGPWPAVRTEGIWNINENHGIRVLLAPLSYSENGVLPEETRFAGETYLPDEKTRAEYKFNSWRVGYRYQLYDEENWKFWLGGTLKVRDAKIELSQGTVSSSDDDVGLVPLLYLAGEYRLNEDWSISADLDGLAGGPGRAIDLGVRLNYTLSDDWQVGVGYRLLEGGADTDDVYNFAWFNSLVVSADYRF